MPTQPKIVGRDILQMTNGPADLTVSPRPEAWPAAAYGLGIPAQMAPRQAGLFVNLRGGGIFVRDFETGRAAVSAGARRISTRLKRRYRSP